MQDQPGPTTAPEQRYALPALDFFAFARRPSFFIGPHASEPDLGRRLGVASAQSSEWRWPRFFNEG